MARLLIRCAGWYFAEGSAAWRCGSQQRQRSIEGMKSKPSQRVLSVGWVGEVYLDEDDGLSLVRVIEDRTELCDHCFPCEVLKRG